MEEKGRKSPKSDHGGGLLPGRPPSVAGLADRNNPKLYLTKHMLTATLTIPEALQIIIYIDTMQTDDQDPLHALGLSIEEALRRAGLDDGAIFEAEHDNTLEEKALERLLSQIEIEEGEEPAEGSVSFTISDREEDALLAEVFLR
jgi:hypothetical protein